MDDILDPVALLWRASWQGAVLAVAVLGLTRILGRWLTPAWRYGLWLVVLARLALPVLPTASWSVWRLADHQPVAIAASGSQVPGASIRTTPATGAARAPLSTPPESSAAGARSPSPWQILMTACWLAGGIVGLGWYMLSWWRLRRRIAIATMPVDGRLAEALERAARIAGLARIPVLREIPDLAGPATFGVLRPVLLLPGGLINRLDDQELDDVLLHECTHLRRGDVAAVWVATAVLCLHWWNPMAWLAVRRLRIEQELACDAAVLGRLPAPRHHGYAASLVQLAALAAGIRQPRLVAGATGARQELMERITMIHRHAARSRRWFSAGALLVLAIAGTALLDAPSRALGAEPATSPDPALRIDLTPDEPVPAWHAQLIQRLEQKKMTWDFTDKPMDQVVAALHEATGVTIVVPGSAPAITMQVKGMNGWDCLRWVATIAGRHIELRDGTVVLVEGEVPPKAKRYDLAALGPGDQQQLLRILDNALGLGGALTIEGNQLVGLLSSSQQQKTLSMLVDLATRREYGTEVPEDIRIVQEKLEVAMSVAWTGQPLMECVDLLQRKASVNVVVDPVLIMKKEPVVTLQMQNRPVCEVLDTLCTLAHCAWVIRDRSVFISDGASSHGMLREAHYRLAVGRGQEQERILSTALAPFLGDGQVNSLASYADILVAHGDERFHTALRNAVAKLRAAKTP